MKHFKIMCVWFCMATMAYAFPVTGGAADWTRQDSMLQGNTINNVWGDFGADVFAVGDGGTILHYNGSVWSEMTSGTTQDLEGVWGSSGSDVFAVGGTIISR